MSDPRSKVWYWCRQFGLCKIHWQRSRHQSEVFRNHWCMLSITNYTCQKMSIRMVYRFLLGRYILLDFPVERILLLMSLPWISYQCECLLLLLKNKWEMYPERHDLEYLPRSMLCWEADIHSVIGLALIHTIWNRQTSYCREDLLRHFQLQTLFLLHLVQQIIGCRSYRRQHVERKLLSKIMITY